MGIGWNIVPRLGHVLLLHLERCKVDRQSSLFHCIVPICAANGAIDSWYYTARGYRWNQILYYTQFLQANGIRGN